MVAMKTEMRIL